MKRANHLTDIKLYRAVFNIYFDVVKQMHQRTDLELESHAEEKKLFRPYGMYHKFRSRYLRLFERAGLKDDKIEINIDGFTCSFTRSNVIEVKRQIERRLVTPKHHLYYFRLMESYKEAQAA